MYNTKLQKIFNVNKIIISDGTVKGLMTGDGNVRHFDQVISTIPLPFVPDMIDDLPEHISDAYKKIDNIGVVCVIIKLKKQVTENFWLNINDERLDVPGIIEYSNLRDLDVNVVYVPFYLPRDHKKFQRIDQDFIDEARAIIKTVNPSIQDDDIIDIHASRYGYAQPICPPEFKTTLPPMNGIIGGLIIADTSYYYPEDRSISESVNLGKSLARLVQ